MKPFLLLSVLVTARLVISQSLATDPGVRSGAAGAGGTIAGLTSGQTSAFASGRGTFNEANAVTGGAGGLIGLGPRFDSNSCVSCHAQPAGGGSSPGANPLFKVFQLNGATNKMPSFITASGPVVVARFPFAPDLVTPDGHVQQLFTVTGRKDAPGCNIAQPDFGGAAAANNLIFRLTTPVFGGGLVELVRNSDILANMNSNLVLKQSLGISGHPSISPDDGTISRFGWKAQAKSLLLFAGEAYNIEEGVSNENSPGEIDETPGCLLNSVPEDHTRFTPTLLPSQFNGDPEMMATFMRFLDQPQKASQNSSDINGQAQFDAIGCVLCHTTSFTTPPTTVTALSKIQVNLFSDLLVHHMGPCLADNIVQGNVQGDEFRTAPLWGVGKRLFFLHDGRTSDIVQAIEAHSCAANSQYSASEANAVIAAFNALSQKNQQDLVNFLRSL
jgi:CxxC motif-containing protein (DUF1111 family)